MQGKPVDVYHRLQNPEDFDAVNEDGFKGNFPILTSDGKKLNRAYFGLLPPDEPDDNYIIVHLNNGDHKLNISDARGEGADVILGLTNNGFDGYVAFAGVYVSTDRNYMLCVLDGEKLKNCSSRLKY